MMFWDAAPPLLSFLSGSLWHRINKGLGLGGDPPQKDHGGGVQKLPVLLRYSVSCMGPPAMVAGIHKSRESRLVL